MMKITNFNELIQPFLKKKFKNCSGNLRIDSYTTKPLVPPGENYGSIILAVEVIVNVNNTKQTIHLVAKLNPPSEVFKKIFNISIAFKKEAEFYKIIVPMLHDYQRRAAVERLDSFATYFGSRYSLTTDPSVFDEDACLVLENMKYEGFASVDRRSSYDLPTAEYVMKLLAHFHALPIALKTKEPEAFARVKELLRLNYTDPEITYEYSEKVIAMTTAILRRDAATAALATRVAEVMRASAASYVRMDVVGREPFNTITHNDIWISNILLRFDSTTKAPIANRLIDFQMAAYGNPGNDVLFFTHSSVKAEVLSASYDHLIDLYYEEFIAKLEEYDVDTGSFTKKAFLTEVDDAARSIQLYHILFMIVHVFLETETEKGENIDFSDSQNITSENLQDVVSDTYVKHLRAVVLNYAKHGWL